MPEAEINRMKYMVCCPMCDNDKCCRGTDKCDAEMWAKRKRLDERTQELFQQLARVTNQCVQEVVEKCEGLLQPVSESIATTCEQLGDLELPDLSRPPAEIRKDIKHEKNPLRLRQLNKELNKSYKVCKRKRGRKDGRKFRRI